MIAKVIKLPQKSSPSPSSPDAALVAALADRLEWMALHDPQFRELLQRKGIAFEPEPI